MKSTNTFSKNKGIYIQLILAILGGLVCVILGYIFIKGIIPVEMIGGKCLFHDNFHMYCPGCGGTRAAFALVHLDIVDSIMCNPLDLYILFMYIFYIVALIWALKKEDDRDHLLSLGMYVTYGFLAMTFLVFIVRNILLVCFHYDYLGDFIPR